MEIVMRAVGSRDLAVLHALHGDPATNEHNPFGANPDLDATRRMLDGWVIHRERFGFGYDAVELEGHVIGVCGARHDVWKQHPVVNLYWRLLPEHWGRGLSSELAGHALRVARTRPDADDRPIVARMLAGNIPSRRVAERLSLQRYPELDADGWIVFVDQAAPPLT